MSEVNPHKMLIFGDLDNQSLPLIMRPVLLLLAIFLFSLMADAQSTLRFDGQNDYVNLGSNAGNGVRTVEMWFKLDAPINPNNINGFKMLCSREVSATNINEWHLSFTPPGTRMRNAVGKLRFAVVLGVGNSKEVFSNSNSWNANQWYHVAAVIHPSQGMMLFIDGVKQTSVLPTYTSPTPTANNDLELGRQRGFSRHFQGEIDDFHLSSRALYTANFTPPCPDRASVSGTRGLWHFNHQSGTIAYDSGPLNLNATISGPSWDTSSVCNKGQTTLAFDGVNDYISLGANSGNNLRTIEFWFKLDQVVTSNLRNAMVLCSREFGPTNLNEFHLSFLPTGTIINAPGVLRFAVVQSVGNTKEVHSNSNSWNANQWYHVAAVIDPVQGMMLFVDGIKQNNTLPNYRSAMPTMGDPLEIARQRGFSSRSFDGNIEDFHISTTALYTANFSPPCPGRTPVAGTVGLYNFNENGGRTAHDASVRLNDVTIHGASWDSSFSCQNQTVDLVENTLPIENSLEDGLNIYPNPSNGTLFFSHVEELARLSIYSMDGRLIREYLQLESNQIQLPEQKGFYLLRFQTHSGEIIQKKVIRE